MGSKSIGKRCGIASIHSMSLASPTNIVSFRRIALLMQRPISRAKAEDRGLACHFTGAGSAAPFGGSSGRIDSTAGLGCTIPSSTLQGSIRFFIVQMPGGIQVGTLAIGSAGAKNRRCFAAAILALSDERNSEKLERSKEADQSGACQQVPR